jgi:hypothetical protein
MVSSTGEVGVQPAVKETREERKREEKYEDEEKYKDEMYEGVSEHNMILNELIRCIRVDRQIGCKTFQNQDDQSRSK